MSIYKKKFQEENVYDAAVERTRELFDRYDKIVVSFSGGKDSTAVLNIALQVAEEKGRLPLEVIHFDEEAIHPPTVEYIERVSKDPRIKFLWYCLPIRHRNGCSSKQPFWFTWNPKEEELWTRPLPETAITHLKGFELGMSVPEASLLAYQGYKGKLLLLLGIRAEESLRRYRMVAKSAIDNYISKADARQHRGFPVYDWTVQDVWTATGLMKWDYNTAYDVMEKAGMSWAAQRVCPPYGEEAIRGLWMYKECFPDMWHKMINRVHGCATAVRYGNTDLYGMQMKELPAKFQTWREYLNYIITDMYPANDQKDIAEAVNAGIREHNQKSINQIPDEDPDPISGCSWKFLAKVALKGDYKARTIRNMAIQTANITSVDEGELMGNYATEAFKQKREKQNEKTRRKSNQ